MTLTEVLKKQIWAEASHGELEFEVQKQGDDGYNVVAWRRPELTLPENAAHIPTRREALEQIDAWYPDIPKAEELDWHV